MKKFKEKRIVKIFDGIAILLFLIFLTSLTFGLFNDDFLIGIMVLPVGALFIILSKVISNKQKYSSQFIVYIRNKLKTAVTLNDLQEIEKEFIYLAVENDSWCLDFPHDLKEIHNEILHRMETLINYIGKHKLNTENVDIIVDHARVHKENAEKGVRIMEMTEALEEAKKELEYHNWTNTSTYFKIVNALHSNN